MILVLLGTQDKPFNRLLKEISNLKKNKVIKDKVIAQIGCSNFEDDMIEIFDFKPKEDIEKLIEDARVIIAHAGVGTLTECLSRNKKIIAVPRLKKHGEHTNDHQLQITKEFAAKNYVLPLYDVKKLEIALDDIKKFKPNKYISNTDNFANNIKKYIDKL